MKFSAALVRGRLVRRYKRFLADVELEGGELVVAHCANSGSMLSVDAPGSEVWLSPAANPDRKLRWTWELVRIGDALVGVNTGHPNRIVEEAIREGRIAELGGYEVVRREVKYGRNSRIDLLLEGAGRPPCYVEVKNVTLLRRPGLAEFPDAVTARGAKHLEELAAMVERGSRAVMAYLVQRPDADRMTPAADIDPTYAAGLERARKQGVEAICYRCDVTPHGIEVASPLPIV